MGHKVSAVAYTSKKLEEYVASLNLIQQFCHNGDFITQ